MISLALLGVFFAEYWHPSFTVLICVSLFAVMMGVADDVYCLSFPIKLLFQVIIALVLYFSGYGIERVTGIYGSTEISTTLGILGTILWVCLIINSINFVDGLDGLAAGVVAIASLSMIAISIATGDLLSLIFYVIIIGISLGFLFHNFYPASIFMGDAGSFFLGTAIATISLIQNTKSRTIAALLVPLIALGFPVLDILVTVVRRWRLGKPVYLGDRRHLHYRLLAIRLPHRVAVLVVYMFSVYMGLLAFLFSLVPQKYSFIVLVLLLAQIVWVIVVLAYIEKIVSEQFMDKDDKQQQERSSI